jgi:hypothetical protein
MMVATARFYTQGLRPVTKLNTLALFLVPLLPLTHDHFGDGRFRHGCTFLRVREDKLPKDCLLEQVVEQAAIQNINAFIEAGLATAGTNR